ncbi:hypothetical protein MFRU_001g01420 [Monilinia fructicola]|nr:hypothetical protein MFRU_001g01420 [Monilinia fructicola]
MAGWLAGWLFTNPIFLSISSRLRIQESPPYPSTLIFTLFRTSAHLRRTTTAAAIDPEGQTSFQRGIAATGRHSSLPPETIAPNDKSFLLEMSNPTYARISSHHITSHHSHHRTSKCTGSLDLELRGLVGWRDDR